MAEHAIWVKVFTEGMDSATQRGQLFKYVGRDERGWYFRGRAYTRHYGTQERTNCCLMVQATNEIGTYGKEGGYLGTGEARAALVGGTGRTAILQSDPSLNEQDEVVDLMARSLKFD